MKKYFFILFSFLLLSNNFAFASEPEDSYDKEEEDYNEEEEGENYESTGEKNPNESDAGTENSADNNMIEQTQMIQQEKQQVRQTVDDVLGINRSALSAKQQKQDRQENKKFRQEIKKLRDEVRELKKITKETQKKAKDAQNLANRLKEQQKELVEGTKKTRENAPKPKKKPAHKKKNIPKKSKASKQRKIYTVKQDRIPEYENYLKDFMPNYLNTKSISGNYDVNSLLRQSQTQYPTHRYGKSSPINFWNTASFGTKNEVTVFKDNGINKYTVKDDFLRNSPQKPQYIISQPPHPIGIEEMKNLYGTKDSKKTYFNGKCSCKNKNEKKQSTGWFGL